MSYGLTKDMERTLLDALNDYIVREFDAIACDSLDEYVDDDGKIALAYTEYEDDNERGYVSIQVSYDLLEHEYIYTITMNDGTENIMREPVGVYDFVKDLCNCDFDDFLRTDTV